MSDYIQEKEISPNLIVKVKYEDDPMNPREWDNLTKMVCFHNRYNLGDEHYYDKNDYERWSELEEQIIKDEKPLLIKPLYLYDHSGITISTSPFSCGWDSGQVGWVYITQERVDELGAPMDSLEKQLEGEVKEYDQYIRGQVYSFEVYKRETCSLGHVHEELVDSCGGYYSVEEALNEGIGQHTE